MAGGIKISFVPDVTQLIAATDDVSAAFGDVADSLDDMARDAADAGKTTGTEFQKGTDRAVDGVKELSRSFKDMTDDVSPKAKKVGDDLGDSVKRGTDEASEGVENFRDEADGTAREVAASFDGSADSIAGGFQELAANALSGFGPAGALAGLALAAGIGTFWSGFQEDAERAEQRISDMYDDMIASGAEFVSKDFISDELHKIYKGADDAAIKVSELRELADASGIPEPLLARALVGDEQARAEVTSEIARQRLAINETLDEATAKGSNAASSVDPWSKALRDVEDQIGGVADGFTEAQQNAAAANAAISGITAPTQGVAASAEDARSKFDGLGRQIASLPAVKLDIDTTAADEQLAAFRRRAAATPARVGVSMVGVNQVV